MQDHSISFGIDHNIPIEAQKNILTKYAKYIKNIYTGVPERDLHHTFTTRDAIFLDTYDQRYYDEIIDHARNLGLGLNFTINGNISYKFEDFENHAALQSIMYLNNEEVDEARVDRAIKVIEKYKPEEICTTDTYLETLKTNCNPNIKFVRSLYNNNIEFNDFNTTPYDIYVVRNSFFLTKDVPDNLEYRILLNFACPWGCKGCANLQATDSNMAREKHQKMFMTELSSHSQGSFEKYLAYHMWTGLDITFFAELFPEIKHSYKFASRTSSFSTNSLEYSFEVYTSDKIFDLSKVYMFNVTHSTDAYLYFKDHPEFDYAKFIDYKKEYWAWIKSRFKK